MTDLNSKQPAVAAKTVATKAVSSKVAQHDVILRPLINEKSTEQREKQNQYAFEVHQKASKEDVRSAVEKFFNVKVLAVVRTLNNHGKLRRVGQVQGRKSNWKKAIVTLKDGSNIDFFGTASSV